MATTLSDRDEKTLRSAVQRLKKRSPNRRVWFLGAGASKTFGYPLTRELLPTIVGWSRDREFLACLSGDPKHAGSRNRRQLRRYMAKLLPGRNRKDDSLPLVTSLLSLLDYSLATNQSVLSECSADDTREARRLLERAILEAIPDDVALADDEESRLSAFCRVLSGGAGVKSGATVNIVTTNYDMTSDLLAYQCARVGTDEEDYWSCGSISRRIDYGFRWYDPYVQDPLIYDRPKKPLARLLKLHGSTNWLRCPLCESVFVNPNGPVWHQAYRQTSDHNNMCYCSDTRVEAQIVSPSFVREMREPNLLGIWKTALDTLRDASEWIIIGYGFPDEDLGVRALFTRAYASGAERPHITVVQKDESAANRYYSFFPERDVSYCVGGLEPFTDMWRQAT